MGFVFIEQLKTETVIGIYDWERKIKQNLYFDLKAKWNNRIPAKSDQLSDCLDYEKLANTIKNFVESNQFFVIERVVEEVANLILTEFLVEEVEVIVYKPSALSFARRVGIKIERKRNS